MLIHGKHRGQCERELESHLLFQYMNPIWGITSRGWVCGGHKLNNSHFNCQLLETAFLVFTEKSIQEPLKNELLRKYMDQCFRLNMFSFELNLQWADSRGQNRIQMPSPSTSTVDMLTLGISLFIVSDNYKKAVHITHIYESVYFRAK